jgi:lipopolysaccharide export LptBFGC system permease protein LptF
VTRPGTRLRAMAARVFDAKTMERYVDPAIADLQVEYDEAAMCGPRRERARVMAAGYLGVIQVVTIQGCLQGIDAVRNATDDDRRALLRTVLASTPVLIIATLTLIAPFIVQLRSHPRSTDLAIYLIPQALPLSIPVALTFGILWGLSRLSTSRTAMVLVLVLALGGSLVSFATLGWVMPNANQTFRTVTAGSRVARGANELTLGELRERITNLPPLSPPAPPSLALNYHQRWALGATPFVLAIFAVIVATGRRSSRAMPFVITPLLVFGFYALMFAVRGLTLDRTLSPFIGAWVPNVVMLILSAAVVSLRLHRRKRNRRGSCPSYA